MVHPPHLAFIRLNAESANASYAWHTHERFTGKDKPPRAMIERGDRTLALSPRRLSGKDSRTRLFMAPWTAMRAQTRVLFAIAIAVAFTIATSPFSISVHSPSGKTMLDTAAGLIGALATFVFLERWRSTQQLRDLLLALFLGVFSLSNLMLAVGPPLIDVDSLPNYVEIAAALLASALAIVLARHSANTANDMERSLAAGAAVLAIAHFDRLLGSSLNHNRLYPGDALKLSAYLLILHGCLVEYRNLQHKLVKQVAVDERRRMARDMHDGLAQELAFIASHSQRLSHTGEDAATVAHLRSAAERALHDSRTTIAVLTATDDLPLDQLIIRTVSSFRSRFGVDIELDLQQDVIVDDEWRNALLRILHEALNNAVRHGSAQRILVSLGQGSSGSSLRIVDDGSGFDVPAALSASRGLGLTSMQERAGLLGGTLRILSTPDTGTVVEVGLP
jgi:signal transduction histidine kinase